MAKNKKSKARGCCCETCINLVPIGEGDHICDEDPMKMVLEDYAPTDDYSWCQGKKYIER